jgi:hypothetical protein
VVAILVLAEPAPRRPATREFDDLMEVIPLERSSFLESSMASVMAASSVSFAPSTVS